MKKPISLPKLSSLLAVLALGFGTGSLPGATIVNDPLPGTGNFTLIPNGDFENGKTGWSDFTNGGRGIFNVTSNQVFAGGASAESFSNTFFGPGFALNQTIGGLTPGATYVLSGYRFIDAAPGVQAYIDINDALGDPNLFLGEARNPGGWQFGYASFVAPASSITIRIVQDFGGGTSTPSDKVYLDNIGLTPANAFEVPSSSPVPEPVRGVLFLVGGIAVVLRRDRRRSLCASRVA